MNFLSDTILPEKLSLFLYKCKRTFLEQNDTYEKHFSFSMFPFPVALVTCNGPGRWAILQTPVKGSRGRARGGHNMPRRGAPAERTGRGACQTSPWLLPVSSHHSLLPVSICVQIPWWKDTSHIGARPTLMSSS